MGMTKTFYLQSGGVAYNLDVGFVCDRVEIKNLTQWETDTKTVQHYWNKSMTDAYAYTEICEDDGLNRSIQTTNGFTPYDTTAVTDNQDVIVGASQANPCVVTATAHGFGDAGDTFTVRIRDIVGMTSLNGNLYKATIVNANTFSLKTMAGDNLDSTGYDAYVSGGNAYALSLTVEDEGFYGMTLGTGIVGADSDWLEVVCHADDQFIYLGDIGV